MEIHTVTDIGKPSGGRSERPQRPAEAVVAEAAAIWANVRARKEEAADGGKPFGREQLGPIQDAHIEFCREFPIVLRAMVEPGLFSKKVFGAWLARYAAAELKSREDLLRCWAEYPAELLSRGKHWGLAEKRALAGDIAASLSAEYEEFAKAAEEAEAEVKRQAAVVSAIRKRLGLE